MRIAIPILSTLLVVYACSPPDAQTNNPAVATESSTAERASQAPAEGANSFTQAQAYERLAKKGYTNPTGFTQASDGTWQGQAMLNGQQINISVDYQGNIVSR